MGSGAMVVSSPYAIFRAVDLGWPPRSAESRPLDTPLPVPPTAATGSAPARRPTPARPPRLATPTAPPRLAIPSPFPRRVSPSPAPKSRAARSPRPTAAPATGGCPPSPRSSISRPSRSPRPTSGSSRPKPPLAQPATAEASTPGSSTIKVLTIVEVVTPTTSLPAPAPATAIAKSRRWDNSKRNLLLQGELFSTGQFLANC